MKKLPPYCDYIFLLLAALAARFYFATSVLEHRIAQFGDAYYFLQAGAQLLSAVQNGSVFGLTSMAPVTQGIQSMTSIGLIDRLLLDGPIYPSFLAAVQMLIGVNAALPQFDAHTLQLVAANAIVDSALCLLIYAAATLIFDRKTALFAGALYAFYPPAIINTASCYSEQFSAFVLMSWTLAILHVLRQPTSKGAPLVWFVAGLLTSALILVKPIFFLLPLSAIAIIGWSNRHQLLSLRSGVVTAAIGASIIAAPWLFFTATVTGKPTLFVNRAPAFNVAMGNRLDADGYRPYPVPHTTSRMEDAISYALGDLKSKPPEFVAMELRKVSRLWAGAWNTFEYSFVLDPKWQDILHQSILFLAFAGLLQAVSATRSKFELDATALLGAIVLIHCIYAVFEPISRYAATAMPSIAIYAGLSLALMFRNESRLRDWLPAILAVVFIGCRRLLPSVHPFTAYVFHSADALAAVDMLFWVLTWLGVGLTTWYCVKPGKVAAPLLVAAWTGVAAVLVSVSLAEPSVFEWESKLRPGDTVVQKIRMPADLPEQKFFVILDAVSDSLTPPAAVAVNGVNLGKPLPWWQVSGGNNELIDALSVQANAMGVNVANYRQWWAFEVPNAAVIPGEVNIVSVVNESRTANLTIFGDYYKCDTQIFMPSLERGSWTKAFATISRGDSRLFDKYDMRSVGTNSVFRRSGKINHDLSRAFGKQFGHYRIRMLALGGKADTTAQNSVSAWSTLPEQHVDGSFPPSFFITKNDVKFNLPAPESFFILSGEIKSAVPKNKSSLSITLHGDTDKGPIEWSSKWTPSYLAPGKDWQPVRFGDQIPSTVASAKNLRFRIVAAPFPSDMLFLRKKKALKQSMDLRNLSVALISAPLSESEKKERFTVY